MKSLFIIIFILFLLSFGTSLFGQSNRLKLKRVNPNGWFSILVPQNSENFLPHGSIDGGDIDSKEIGVEFNYWQYRNMPISISNTINAYSNPPISVCSNRSHARTWKIAIDGKKAIAQTCFDNQTSDFFYHVNFPKLKVFEIESRKFRYGIFNLTITYKNKLYLLTAKRIANSLKFRG